MLNHEETHQEGGGRQSEQKARPVAQLDADQRADPEGQKRDGGHDEFEQTALEPGRPIGGKLLRPFLFAD